MILIVWYLAFLSPTFALVGAIFLYRRGGHIVQNKSSATRKSTELLNGDHSGLGGCGGVAVLRNAAL
jgi:hypothetical protein